MTGRADGDRRVVLGLGNTLNTDEGVGGHCLEPLRQRLGSADVEVLDGGVLGMELLPLVESCSHLLILDAVDAGKPPGTIVELEGGEIPLFARLKLSWHQLGFQEVLQFASVRGRLPAYLHLVGVQPADIATGYGLSPVLEALLPQFAERAVAVLERWGLVKP
jgi:hydrogenase maturation protease